jgi:plasmid stabilization system protein ParE
MRFTLRVLAEAESEITEIGNWYQRQQPRSFPEIEPEIRRAVMKRFPYAIFFAVVGRQITVLRVRHVARES